MLHHGVLLKPLMAKRQNVPSKRRHLRKYIIDMVNNIEEVMVNINIVLGEVSGLVQQIDSITERMENSCGERQRFSKGSLVLDSNQNACDVIETPGLSNTSKLTFPSPYMDYTYLELTHECNTCNDNLNNYRLSYNEKYPLWIQCDSWKPDHSISDMSEVTSGSDSDSLVHNESYDKSWKSVSNIVKNNSYPGQRKEPSRKYDRHHEEDVIHFSKCCHNPDTGSSETYCGVYEHIMEQQLEDLDSLAPDLVIYRERNGSFSSQCDSSSDMKSIDSERSWTNNVYFPDMSTTRLHPSERTGVSVKEFSDSNPSLSD